jgi:hypothetical protein
MRGYAVVVVLLLASVHVAFHVRAREEAMHAAPACAPAVPLGAVCGRCVAAFCCAEITACYSRADCIDVNDCTIECGESGESGEGGERACQIACARRHPEASAAFTAWNVCARRHCATECPRGDED